MPFHLYLFAVGVLFDDLLDAFVHRHLTMSIRSVRMESHHVFGCGLISQGLLKVNIQGTYFLHYFNVHRGHPVTCCLYNTVLGFADHEVQSIKPPSTQY